MIQITQRLSKIRLRQMGNKRRIAASTVKCGEKEYHNYVVEFTDGKVTDMYPLVEELPFTEWQDELIIKD